jgi:hypothetical protein
VWADHTKRCFGCGEEWIRAGVRLDRLDRLEITAAKRNGVNLHKLRRRISSIRSKVSFELSRLSSLTSVWRNILATGN